MSTAKLRITSSLVTASEGTVRGMGADTPLAVLTVRLLLRDAPALDCRTTEAGREDTQNHKRQPLTSLF
jgi:hypothetical protein